jgi:hypothetical protein
MRQRWLLAQSSGVTITGTSEVCRPARGRESSPVSLSAHCTRASPAVPSPGAKIQAGWERFSERVPSVREVAMTAAYSSIGCTATIS